METFSDLWDSILAILGDQVSETTKETGIDNKSNVREKVIVVPFGLEKTVSYGGGTSKGPKEIIKASHQVELFDE